MIYVSEAEVRKELLVYIDGRAFQPLRKILTKGELLELAGLDPGQYEIFLVDDQDKEHRIDSDEGLELQHGMELKTRRDSS